MTRKECLCLRVRLKPNKIQSARGSAAPLEDVRGYNGEAVSKIVCAD